MRHYSLPIGIFAIACGLLAGATLAQAQTAAETWVSATGNDTGTTCSRTAPCRTFQFAHNQTAGGGSINVLTPGNFGPVTIIRSMSIVADVEAIINTSAGGSGIIVNGSNIVVSLRGLTIDIIGSIGISFVQGAALHVQNCVIRRTTTGISVRPAAGISEFYGADMVVADTTVGGIDVSPSGSGSAKVVLDRVRVENSVNTGMSFQGFNTSGSIDATVTDSVSAGNSVNGIFAQESGGGGLVNVMVDRTAAVNNNSGIRANGAGATIFIGNSTVSGNQTGLAVNLGAIVSFGTNKVRGNVTNGAPTSTIAGQ